MAVSRQKRARQFVDRFALIATRLVIDSNSNGITCQVIGVHASAQAGPGVYPGAADPAREMRLSERLQSLVAVRR